MLMVIIGAGASYDSSFDKLPGTAAELRPPLADDLFHERYRQFRQDLPLSGILAELVPRPGRVVEEVLHRMQQQAETNPARTQQLAAVRFYLQELLSALPEQWLTHIGGITNFNALVDQIQNGRRASGNSAEPVCLVTFNYDTLLERALTKEFGIKFDAIDDYVSHPEFKLFKLHGSVNWGRFVGQAPMRTRWSREAMIRDIDRLVIADQIVPTHGYSGHVPLFPAIAIPLREKSKFECPAEHLAQFASLIPKVTKLLTIGWRAAENHFLSLLRNRSPLSAVAIAATEAEANETINRMRTFGVGITQQKAWSGFSDTIGNGLLHDFFAS